jgi:hypothetical protein
MHDQHVLGLMPATASLIAVLLPMLPALLDATDLCQAYWRAAARQAELEAVLDHRLDQAAHGARPSPKTSGRSRAKSTGSDSTSRQ